MCMFYSDCQAANNCFNYSLNESKKWLLVQSIKYSTLADTGCSGSQSVEWASHFFHRGVEAVAMTTWSAVDSGGPKSIIK